MIERRTTFFVALDPVTRPEDDRHLAVVGVDAGDALDLLEDVGGAGLGQQNRRGPGASDLLFAHRQARSAQVRLGEGGVDRARSRVGLQVAKPGALGAGAVKRRGSFESRRADRLDCGLHEPGIVGFLDGEIVSRPSGRHPACVVDDKVRRRVLYRVHMSGDLLRRAP